MTLVMKTQWPDNFQTLRTWWRTPIGQASLDFEKQVLQQRLSHLFGYQLLLLADDTFANYAMDSRLLNYTRIDPLEKTNSKQTHFQLPNNIDVIIIPHWIYYFPDLQPLIASLWHSLMNGGLLIITGDVTCRFFEWEWFGKKGSLSQPEHPLLRYRQMKKLLTDEQFVIERAYKYRQPSIRRQLTLIEATKKTVTIKKMKPCWHTRSTPLTQSILSHWNHTRHDH